MQDQRGVADSYQIQEFDSAVDKIEKAGAKVVKSIPLMKPTPELGKILGRVAHSDVNGLDENGYPTISNPFTST
jgi:hypothetical protein